MHYIMNIIIIWTQKHDVFVLQRTLIDDKTQAYVRVQSDERLKREVVSSVLYTHAERL